MELNRKIIQEMHQYYSYIKNSMYGTRTKKERSEAGQFFTPPELGSLMLAKYDCTLEEFSSKTILDPTCGAGLLLAYACIAGANPEKVFGIELDSQMVEIARKELGKFGVPAYNIHHGNALNSDCYIFPESKYEPIFPPGVIYTFDKDKGEFGTVVFMQNGKEFKL